MAENDAVDVTITTGVNGDASKFDNFSAKKAEASAVTGDDHLKERIEELEHEKRDLVREIAESKEAVEQIEEEDGDEAGREIERMRSELEELRREKSTLSVKMSAQAEELKRSSSDFGSKIRELEKKLEGLQESESEAKREKVLAEEQAKARLDGMERELTQLKNEKTEVEEAMRALEAELKKSEEKVMEMEEKVVQLAQKAKESEDLVAGMVEKAAQRGLNGIVEAGQGGRGFGDLKKIQIPVAGAVSAVVVVAAVAGLYIIRFCRTR